MTNHKKIIIEAMREVFPNILPSLLQEARQAILTHLNMSKDDFGLYPSNKPKFDNLCSEAVKTLKSTGEMSTKGWEWRWNGSVVSEVEVDASNTDISNNDMEMEMEMEIEDDLFQEVAIQTTNASLYDLTCEDTLIRLVATTSCFGKVVQSDPMCQGCPLLSQCSVRKGESQQAKKEARETKEEALKIAKEAGYNLSKVKVPKGAKINETNQIEAQANTSCVVTSEPILKGEVAYHIPSWGMVKKSIGDAYKAMNNL